MADQSRVLSAVLLLVSMSLSICGGSAPVLTTSRAMTLTGPANPGDTVAGYLRGKDADNDRFDFTLKRAPATTYINTTTLSAAGKLEFTDICSTCTGTTTFEVTLTDITKQSNSYTLTLTFKDRSSGKLNLVTDASSPSSKSGLLRWHIYLIVLAAITAVGVTSSLVMYNCCSFDTDMYSAPIKRPNKIIDYSDGNRPGEMNPYAAPRRKSLIVKEAVRAGAADGTPYYGTRKSGVWVPTAPEDNGSRGQPTPLRLMSITEDSDLYRQRHGSIAPVRPPRLPSIYDRGNLDQLSWQEIVAPRR